MARICGVIDGGASFVLVHFPVWGSFITWVFITFHCQIWKRWMNYELLLFKPNSSRCTIELYMKICFEEHQVIHHCKDSFTILRSQEFTGATKNVHGKPHFCHIICSEMRNCRCFNKWHEICFKSYMSSRTFNKLHRETSCNRISHLFVLVQVFTSIDIRVVTKISWTTRVEKCPSYIQRYLNIKTRSITRLTS